MITSLLFAGLALQSQAQVNAIDSVMNHVKGNKLSVGGYGEIGYTREFFSDNPYKYSQAGKYKNDPSHGKFDIPHAVIYLGYDFGKGWTMGTEIEFEHGGSGSSYEKEYEESGEWEHEVEKGRSNHTSLYLAPDRYQFVGSYRAGLEVSTAVFGRIECLELQPRQLD